MTDSFPKLSLTFSEAGSKDGLDPHQPPDTVLGPEHPEFYTASRGWLEKGMIQPTAGWAGPPQGQRPAQERLLLAPRSPPPAREPSCQLRREHPIKCVLVSEKRGFCKGRTLIAGGTSGTALESPPRPAHTEVRRGQGRCNHSAFPPEAARTPGGGQKPARHRD